MMSLFWICCLAPLASVLGHTQANYAGRFPGLWHPKTAFSVQLMKEMSDRLHNEAKVKAIESWGFLDNHYNTTFMPLKGEATHVVIQTVAGKMFNITTIVVEVSCPEEQEPGNYTGCEPLPGSQPKVCNVVILLIPGNEKPFFYHDPCQDFSSYLQRNAEVQREHQRLLERLYQRQRERERQHGHGHEGEAEVEEEGTPYM